MMKCAECRDFKRCLLEAVTRNQVFDTEYEGADCFMPKTNADHIRSMTDEELVDMVECPRRNRCAEVSKGFGSCGDCMLDWLKQPYKENTDG